MDMLHEYCLKMLGDVFESLIGAIFLDSRSLEVTKEVLFRLLHDYIGIYADLDTMQEHSRTLLLELWNSKPYSKNLKINHEVKMKNDFVVMSGLVQKMEVLRFKFTKEQKNKVRKFYRKFFDFIKECIERLEERYKHCDINEIKSSDFLNQIYQ